MSLNHIIAFLPQYKKKVSIEDKSVFDGDPQERVFKLVRLRSRDIYEHMHLGLWIDGKYFSRKKGAHRNKSIFLS